jgi:hypothetical protein
VNMEPFNEYSGSVRVGEYLDLTNKHLLCNGFSLYGTSINVDVCRDSVTTKPSINHTDFIGDLETFLDFKFHFYNRVNCKIAIAFSCWVWFANFSRHHLNGRILYIILYSIFSQHISVDLYC